MDDDLAAFDDLHGKFAAVKHLHPKERIRFNGMDRYDLGLSMPESDRFVNFEGTSGSICKQTTPMTLIDQSQPRYVGLRKGEGT